MIERFVFPRRLSLLLAVALLFPGPAAHGQNTARATLSGSVADDSGAPIPGVTVTAGRSADGASPALAVTDIAGVFRFDELQPGSYEVEAALDGFQPLSRNVKLVTGQKVEIVFTLVPAFGETVEVVAEAVRTGEIAVLETRRQAAVVSDSISSEEIRSTPDSTAASVVERLTGVTLIGDKYVFVRGLGERYSGTTMNGATLPTTETEKRVVPLDLFPAKLLATVNVVKTYTPDRPGDFGSGIVEMTTTDFPGSGSVKVTLGAGYQSGATGSDFVRYAGGLDRWGRGGQAFPAGVPAEYLQRRSSLSPAGFSPDELEAVGEAFIGNWSGDGKSSAAPGTDFSLTYGNTFGPLGVVLSAVSNHKFDSQSEELRFFGMDAGEILVPRNDYEIRTDRESANSGLIGNFSLRINETNRIFVNSLLTRDAASEYRFQEGLNTNSGGLIEAGRVRYQIEEIFSSRLRGEHNLGGGMGSLIEWSIARSGATNDSDLREALYRESEDGAFALEPSFASTNFYTLEDAIEQAGFSYSLFYAGADGWRSGVIKAGADHFERTRDFDSRRFRFAVQNQGLFDLTQEPEGIFTRENIRPGGFEIREVTGVNDAYDAAHTIEAGYVMADSTFGSWRVIGGARYERSNQEVLTFNPFDPSARVSSTNRASSVLPSLNLVYQTGAQTNLRLGYGRSVNRPEFRELSPFSFVEVTGGRSVAGNPDLKDATLDSFDVRWETFPTGGEVIAASLFYKRIDQPIERVIQPTTELRTSFVNADSATLWGAELELRRSLQVITPLLDLWSLNFNYAYVQSDVQISAQQVGVVTSLDRPLEGQSDQVANVALQFHHPQRGTMFRILGAYVGERLADVGAYGLPDIYEAAYTSVDAVVSQQLLMPGLELKLAASNLLDQSRRFLQGAAVQRRYDPGRTVSLSVSYTPF